MPYAELVGLRLTVPADRPNLRIERVMSAYNLDATTPSSSLAFIELHANGQRLDAGQAPFAKVDDRALPTNSRDIGWVVFCSTSASTNCYWHDPSIFDLFKARLYLDEEVDPTITVTGGALVTAGAKAGLQSLGFDAGHADSGVSSVTVALGVTPVGSVQYACAYNDWSACQRNRTSQLLQVDTTKVPDGSHELFITVSDAANNTLTRSLGTVTVANAAAAGTVPNGRRRHDWRRSARASPRRGRARGACATARDRRSGAGSSTRPARRSPERRSPCCSAVGRRAPTRSRSPR